MCQSQKEIDITRKNELDPQSHFLKSHHTSKTKHLSKKYITINLPRGHYFILSASFNTLGQFTGNHIWLEWQKCKEEDHITNLKCIVPI